MRNPRGCPGLFSYWCRCSRGPGKGPSGVRPWDTRKHRVPDTPLPPPPRTHLGVLRASHSAQPPSSPSNPAALHAWGRPVGGDAPCFPAGPSPGGTASPGGGSGCPPSWGCAGGVGSGGRGREPRARGGGSRAAQPFPPRCQPPGEGDRPGDTPAGQQGEASDEVLRATFGEGTGSPFPRWQRPGTKRQAGSAVEATCRGRARPVDSCGWGLRDTGAANHLLLPSHPARCDPGRRRASSHTFVGGVRPPLRPRRGTSGSLPPPRGCGEHAASSHAGGRA